MVVVKLSLFLNKKIQVLQFERWADKMLVNFILQKLLIFKEGGDPTYTARNR
jgi:hypothetical protein